MEKSYDIPPPELDYNDERHPRFDKLYSEITADLPNSGASKILLSVSCPIGMTSSN